MAIWLAWASGAVFALTVALGWRQVSAGPQATQQAGTKTPAEVVVSLDHGVSIRLVRIPAGKFMMGCPDNEAGRASSEGPQHEVTIARPFYLGVFEVTQEQYAAGLAPPSSQPDAAAVTTLIDQLGDKSFHVRDAAHRKLAAMGVSVRPMLTARLKQPDIQPEAALRIGMLLLIADPRGDPSQFKGPNRPVEQVSWEDATAFCRKVSERTGRSFRLPTEAEWEYACRAGSQTRYSFGDDEKALGDHGWSSENSEKSTHPVGQKRPNIWGLYDMHGNVWEWCSDWHTAAYGGSAASGSFRVCRGGAWHVASVFSRSGCRGRDTPGYRGSHIGFRLAMDSE